jgi:hypothetical protein
MGGRRTDESSENRAVAFHRHPAGSDAGSGEGIVWGDGMRDASHRGPARDLEGQDSFGAG